MTQYQSEKLSTASTEHRDAQSAKDKNSLERELKSLTEHVKQQDDELRELRRTVRRLQTEVRAAVNAFNSKHNG